MPFAGVAGIACLHVRAFRAQDLGIVQDVVTRFCKKFRQKPRVEPTSKPCEVWPFIQDEDPELESFRAPTTDAFLHVLQMESQLLAYSPAENEERLLFLFPVAWAST